MPRPFFPELEIRPIAPADRDALAAAFDRLSPESRYQRFLFPKKVLTAAELDALTRLDHLNHDAVVAVERASGRIVGVARYAVKPADTTAADIAFVVADDWQGRGLGLTLGRAVVRRAATSGIAWLTGTTLADNRRSRALLARLGFSPQRRDGAVLELGLELRPAARPSAGWRATA